MSQICLYAPHGTSDCMDLGCRQRGGSCKVVELKDDKRICRCLMALPSTNIVDMEGGAVVTDPVATYRTRVSELEACSDDWFAQTLAAAHSGDDNARRRIVGSCLNLALRVVDKYFGTASAEEFLNRVEDANYILWRSLDSFAGSTAIEFTQHAQVAVEARFSNSTSESESR